MHDDAVGIVLAGGRSERLAPLGLGAGGKAGLAVGGRPCLERVCTAVGAVVPRVLVVAAPDPYHARHVIELVRAVNPAIEVVVRTHGEQEQLFFERLGVHQALMGERELAYSMAYHGLRASGCSDDDADDVLDIIREQTRAPNFEPTAA